MHSLMMGCGVMFGEIIGPIGDPRFPENMKLALMGAITKPVKSHVHGFGALLFDRVIDNPTGDVVVGLQRHGGLRMTQFLQCHADGADGLGIEEECAQFCLGGTGNYLAHDLTQYMDGAIVRWCWVSGCGWGAGAGAEE